jgi:N-methylhydantoinase B
VLAGQTVRVMTTGGGGWGDPLDRETNLVQRDVVEGKVSPEAARSDYGVVFNGDGAADPNATAKLRETIRSKRDRMPAMIDRGPGYDVMLSGQAKPRMRSGV